MSSTPATVSYRAACAGMRPDLPTMRCPTNDDLGAAVWHGMPSSG